MLKSFEMYFLFISFQSAIAVYYRLQAPHPGIDIVLPPTPDTSILVVTHA